MQKYWSHSNSTVGLVHNFPHGILAWEGAFRSAPSSIASSAALTPGCSLGRSRNQRKNATAQITPSAPNATNAQRQLMNTRTVATRNGVNAPPHRALSQRMPCARTRSLDGSQMVKIFVTFGKQPASPAPNRKRHTTMERKFHAAPVAAVKIDHITTTFISTLRGP